MHQIITHERDTLENTPRFITNRTTKNNTQLQWSSTWNFVSGMTNKLHAPTLVSKIHNEMDIN